MEPGKSDIKAYPRSQRLFGGHYEKLDSAVILGFHTGAGFKKISQAHVI